MAMDEGSKSLLAAVSKELRRPCHPSSSALAEAIVARHGRAAVALLFYGSCLRQDPAGVPPEGIQDFYLLVDRYQDAYKSRLPALANWLLPPNVFYIELPWRGQILRAKYAVMSLDQFMRGTSPRSFDPWLWARFSQPAALLHARDDLARTRVQKAIARAVRTMLESTAPLACAPSSPTSLWLAALGQTYRAELRPEGANRAQVIIDADRDRYDRMARLVFAKAVDARGMISIDASDDERGVARRRWFIRRLLGKPLTVLRLMKNLFTFDGGVDYALWKVERHTGVRVPISSFERRHPILTSPRLLWRVFRLGAVR
jgi:hypothetical protein